MYASLKEAASSSSGTETRCNKNNDYHVTKMSFPPCLLYCTYAGSRPAELQQCM